MFDQPQIDQTGEDLEIHHLPSSEDFEWFGKLILAFQLIFAVTFSIYSWLIENEYVAYAVVYIAQGWFTVAIWELTLPHDCCNNSATPLGGLSQKSFIILILSLNPTIMPFFNGHLKDESLAHYFSETIYPLVTSVSALVAYKTLVSMRECLRKQYSEEADLKRIALSHSSKAFLVGLATIYLFSNAISGFGGNSMEEIGQNVLFLQYTNNNIEILSHVKYVDYLDAKEDFKGFLEAFQSIFAGTALNISLASYVLTGDILKFTFVDIVKFQINWIEKVMTFFQLLLVISSLVFLTLDESKVGYGLLSVDANGFSTFHVLLTIILGSGFMIFCFAWYASYSILTNATEYNHFQQRSLRATTEEQKQIKQENSIIRLNTNQIEANEAIEKLKQEVCVLKGALESIEKKLE